MPLGFEGEYMYNFEVIEVQLGCPQKHQRIKMYITLRLINERHYYNFYSGFPLQIMPYMLIIVMGERTNRLNHILIPQRT